MNVCIAGGSGFIGTQLIGYLREQGYQITLITRNDFITSQLKQRLAGQDILINLIGSPINVRWTRRNKERIFESRVKTTRLLVDAINQTDDLHLKAFIQVSAVGIYDSVKEHKEGSIDYGCNFLSGVVKAWENELVIIKSSRIRKVICRLGVVLSREGGFFKKVLPIYKLGFGLEFSLQTGFPYIHIDDVVRIMDYIIKTDEIKGIVNVVSPELISVKDFFNKLAVVQRVRFRLYIPELVIKLFFGEAHVVISEGQYVVPDILLGRKYPFVFPDLKFALQNIIN